MTLEGDILYHKPCYDKFTSSSHIKRIADAQRRASTSASASYGVQSDSATSEPSRPTSRTLISPLDKNLCIFCQMKNRSKTGLVITLEVSEHIMKAAEGDFVMRCRLAGISDLVAADAWYHQQCRIEFLRRMKNTGSEAKVSARDVCFPKLTEEVRAGVSCGHVYTLKDVLYRYEQLLSEAGEDVGIYRSVINAQVFVLSENKCSYL